MKGSLIILSFFVAGVLLGLGIDGLEMFSDYNHFVLYALMFIVGIGVGADKKTLNSLRSQNLRSLLLPTATVVGSLIAALLVTPLISGLTLNEVLAVASGFGYYSLSSIMITEYAGAEIGTIGLVSNIVREVVTLIGAPLMVRYFSPLSVVSSAGAASIDTLLPTITRFSGKEYIVIAIFHGIVMEIAVPVLVTLFLS